nr:unnamed protein product [Digitaria exilis]
MDREDGDPPTPRGDPPAATGIDAGEHLAHGLVHDPVVLKGAPVHALVHDLEQGMCTYMPWQSALYVLSEIFVIMAPAAADVDTLVPRRRRMSTPKPSSREPSNMATICRVKDNESVKPYIGASISSANGIIISQDKRHSGIIRNIDTRGIISEFIAGVERSDTDVCRVASEDIYIRQDTLGQIVKHTDCVEATVELLISEVRSSFDLSLSCFTSRLNKGIWLFNGAIAESCGLKRSVVAVRKKSSIDLRFKIGAVSSSCSFKAKTHGHDTQEIKTDLAFISVKLKAEG